MRPRTLISIMSLTVCMFGSVLAGYSVTKVGDSVVDSEALNLGDKKFGKVGFGKGINGCSFQQDAVVTHKKHQYVGYYDGKRQVCIARRELPKGAWEIIRFGDYKFKNNDAHNTISIGICPNDGTIHMAFDHHVHPLHYRVSKKGASTNPETVAWEASLFGPIVSSLEKGKPIKVTYPRFWQTPDGGLQFCYRRGGSGRGDRMLVDYDPKTGTWANTRQIDSGKGKYGKSGSRCSYPNGYTYGPKGNLHATWVWREGAGSANHDLIYSYSDDRGKTWLNTKGDRLKEPPAVDSPGITAVTIHEKYGLMNTHGQAVDSKGRIHVVMRHCSDDSFKTAGSKPGAARFGIPAARRYFHYWRMTDGTWKLTELPGVAGNRPKVFMDASDNAFLIFQKAGNLVFMGAQASTKWTDWTVIHTEAGPFHNEMLGDLYRWKRSGILSIMVVEGPKRGHEPTPLRILDFQFK